jgi:hypothetical protein
MRIPRPPTPSPKRTWSKWLDKQAKAEKRQKSGLGSPLKRELGDADSPVSTIEVVLEGKKRAYDGEHVSVSAQMRYPILDMKGRRCLIPVIEIHRK